MSDMSTLTGNRSNRMIEDRLANLDPLRKFESLWDRAMNEYLIASPTLPATTVNADWSRRTWNPQQERFISPRLNELTVEVNSSQLPIGSEYKLERTGVIGYIVMESPEAVDSLTSVSDRISETADPEELRAVLDDLAGVKEEARIEEFPIPSQSLVDEAERIIRIMYKHYPTRFEVSADPDGAIAIDVRDGNGQWVLLLCDPDGDALVLTNLEVGKCRRFPLEDGMLVCFLRDAFGQLTSKTPQFR